MTIVSIPPRLDKNVFQLNSIWKDVADLAEVEFLDVNLVGGLKLWKRHDQVHLSLIGLPKLLSAIYDHSLRPKRKLQKLKSPSLNAPYQPYQRNSHDLITPKDPVMRTSNTTRERKGYCNISIYFH